MKCALTVVLTSRVILATTASLAADCDEVTAANLNSEVEEELLPLEVSGNLKPSEESKIKELKQRSAEAGIIQIQALYDNNKEELQKHYDSYRSIINETKKINE